MRLTKFDKLCEVAYEKNNSENAERFRWLLENATLTTTLRNGVKVWSLEVVGDYPHDAGMLDILDMIDVSRGA